MASVNPIIDSSNPFDEDYVDDTDAYVEEFTAEKHTRSHETIAEVDEEEEIFYETFETFEEMNQASQHRLKNKKLK